MQFQKKKSKKKARRSKKIVRAALARSSGAKLHALQIISRNERVSNSTTGSETESRSLPDSRLPPMDLTKSHNRLGAKTPNKKKVTREKKPEET